MKKLFTILVFTILSINISHSQMSLQLGDSAFASLLTCGAGNEFYEVFGHTALRICDSTNHIDLVFNYGSFDDFEDGFYLKFAKGMLNYCVMAQIFSDFMFEYMFFGREVWEQKLDLTHDEVRSLFKALVINSQPENMYYSYDFFRDNCATRVHNIIENNLDNRRFVHSEKMPGHTSFRDLVQKYTVDEMPWWETGIDILLGARCDRAITERQYIFAPIEMMQQYDTICTSDGKPLANAREKLLPDQREPKAKNISPTLAFVLLFIVVLALSLFGQQKGWKLLWLDGILFGLAGLISLLLLYLWLGSDHWCTKWNFNLLWANPLFLVLLFRLRKKSPILRKIVLGCLALMLLIWIIGWPQHFSTVQMLIALTLAIRTAIGERGKVNSEKNK